MKPNVVRLPQKFDLAKFEAMVEPFSVRVEKIKGSMKSEIPLPPSEDGSSGTGLSKEQVRDLQTWLVKEWSGGGHYAIAITDSSVPPQTMEWIAYYPVHEFPEKIPPTLQGAYFPSVPVTAQQVKSMAQFPGSGAMLPAASYFQQPQPQYPSQPMPMPMPQSQPQPQGYYPYGYAPQVAPSTNNSEVQVLRDALTQAREQAAQRDFERRVAEMKADADRRFVELQQMMQQMVHQMTATAAAAAKPVIDPAVEQHRETIRRLEDQVRLQAEVVARERRDAEVRDQIRASQEETRRLVEAANQRYESFMREATTNKGPDPQLMMFQTMMQSQMEATKEIARTSQSQFDRMQSLMMRPQDVLQIAKESSTGVDHVALQMNRAWEQMFSVSRQLTEQAAQLNQGGGNEVIGLVRDAGTRIGEWAEKYTGGKTKEAVASMNAQAEIARAQADVIKSQQDRMTEMARMEMAMKTGTTVQMPNGTWVGPPGTTQAAMPAGPAPAPSPTPGSKPANGAHVTPPWIPPKTPRTDGTNAANGAGTPASGLGGASEPGQVIPIKPIPKSEQRHVKGRTDEEWFSLMLPNVIELRVAVDKFIEGLKQIPPEKVKDSASPEEAAFAIQAAAMEIMQRQIPIPAMIELLLQGMVADFLDVLLPDAPQTYRDDVVKILMNGGVEEPDDDDDDDGDDDDKQPQPVS